MTDQSAGPEKCPQCGATQGWISVKEKLPPHGQKVLMWLVTVDPRNSGVVVGSRTLYKKRDKFWDGIGYRDFSRITHWQSLPDAPDLSIVERPTSEAK